MGPKEAWLPEIAMPVGHEGLRGASDQPGDAGPDQEDSGAEGCEVEELPRIHACVLEK